LTTVQQDDMRVELEQPDGEAVTVVHVQGTLDRFSCPHLKDLLFRKVEAGDVELVIDLGGVDSVDSSGLGVLVGTLKLARRAGGDLRITGASHRLSTTIERLSLDQLLRHHPSVQDAVASFRTAPHQT
jgi:anti-sigma B factor antagonist